MEWAEGSINEFLSMIEDSSVEQLKSFIENSGDGHLPFSGPFGSSISQRAIIGCMAKPSEAVEKVKFLVDEGMTQPYFFSIADFVKHDYRGCQFYVENTPEELEAIKGVLRFLSSQGWKFTEENRREIELKIDLELAIRAYHADLDFLMLLSKMGLNFDEAKELDYNIVAFLFENSSIDTLDYLVEKGLKLTRCGKCTIASDWTKEFADYLISKDQPVLLERFASDCNFDVYCHAAEKSGMKCDNPVELWGNVVNSKRFDIGEWLLQKGAPICSEAVYFGIDDMEAMDWALAKGFKFEVDVGYCSRDTLLYAAKHGAKPCGSLKIDTETHQVTDSSRGRTVDTFSGMRAICELFDFELIKAFLEAGYADEADASSAVEAENQELIDLYASYGVDTTLKVVVDGSEFVSGGVYNGESYRGGGVAKIPEGIEEIRPDAFIDCRFDSVELPETLKVIGSRAFARKWRDVGREKVVVPRSVVSLGYGAFAGFKEIYVYDNIDADAAPAHSRVDDSDGSPNGSVGWVGIAPRLSCDSWPRAADVPYRFDHKIIVLSAETGEIKYKVDMPIGDADRAVYCTLVSAWGKNAEFDFSVYKKIFKKLPCKLDKLTAALYRLMWPVNLDEEGREFYEKYVVRCAKDAAVIFANQGNLDGFKLLASIGAIKKTNIDYMIVEASDAHCEKIVEYLESYKAESFPVKKAATAKRKRPQLVNGRLKRENASIAINHVAQDLYPLRPIAREFSLTNPRRFDIFNACLRDNKEFYSRRLDGKGLLSNKDMARFMEAIDRELVWCEGVIANPGPDAATYAAAVQPVVEDFRIKMLEFARGMLVPGEELPDDAVPAFTEAIEPQSKKDTQKLAELLAEVRLAYGRYRDVVKVNGFRALYPRRTFDEPQKLDECLKRLKEANAKPYDGLPDNGSREHVEAFWQGFYDLVRLCERCASIHWIPLENYFSQSVHQLTEAVQARKIIDFYRDSVLEAPRL